METLPLEFGNKYSMPEDVAVTAATPSYRTLLMHPVVQGFVHWMLNGGYTKASFEIVKDAVRETDDPDLPGIALFESRIRVTDVS